MIPKEDPDAVPRVVHDYCAVNAKTLKGHTPLTRQDDIIECLARARWGARDIPIGSGHNKGIVISRPPGFFWKHFFCPRYRNFRVQ